jgi:hypothetical protein
MIYEKRRMSLNSPAALVSLNSPDALVSLNSPDALVSLNSPDALVLTCSACVLVFCFRSDCLSGERKWPAHLLCSAIHATRYAA